MAKFNNANQIEKELMLLTCIDNRVDMAPDGLPIYIEIDGGVYSPCNLCGGEIAAIDAAYCGEWSELPVPCFVSTSKWHIVSVELNSGIHQEPGLVTTDSRIVRYSQSGAPTPREIAIGNPMKVVDFYCNMLAKASENGEYAVADIDGSGWRYGCYIDATQVEILHKKMMNTATAQKCSGEFVIRRLDADDNEYRLYAGGVFNKPFFDEFVKEAHVKSIG